MQLNKNDIPVILIDPINYWLFLMKPKPETLYWNGTVGFN